MSGALCIDFGTSSIRAVRRMPSGRLKPLDIGRVTRSRLDNASIRSAIHVDEAGRYVRYAERAIGAPSGSTVPLLYETSPKLWLKEPDRLAEPAAPGMHLSREDLLAGLLAYAIRASAEADDIGVTTLKQLDLRIAHPVWPEPVRDAAIAALARVAAQARQIAFEHEWGTVTVATLGDLSRSKATSRASSADVVEPIAAATDLLPNEDNFVRICAVADVGAGTTDIGLFRSLMPDSRASEHSNIEPLGQPTSVFKAGDLIDDIVFDLLESRGRKHDASALSEVKARIRSIKETLFEVKHVQELGADVRLDDLQSHPRARAMARDIRAEFEKTVLGNGGAFIARLGTSLHSIRRLDLVLAGGGGTIEFLRNALKRPLMVDGEPLPVNLIVPRERSGMNMFGASRGRMAVAMGGASRDYDLLNPTGPAGFTQRRGSL